MAFDYPALMNELFPKPKSGEWVPCDFGLPPEFDLVVFAIDDGSTEGLLYLGYREDRTFRVMYGETKIEPFAIGGEWGVGFWTPLPEPRGLFHQ